MRFFASTVEETIFPHCCSWNFPWKKACACNMQKFQNPVDACLESMRDGGYTCGVPEYLMYKNHLQEYAQSFGLQLPAYSSVNEGVNHLPKFRASVFIDGEKYESYETFLHQRDAEQNVARIALESISKRMKDEANFFIREDKLFCKSILIEFAVKLKLKVPTYKTGCSMKGPDFVSSLIFDRKHYTGTPGKNKKEAEQMAARIAIQSFLAAGDSSSSILLARIIKSKIKLCPSHHMVNGCSYYHGDNTTSNGNLDTSAPSLPGKRKAVEQVAQNQVRKPNKDLLTNVENGSNGRKWQTDGPYSHKHSVENPV